MLKEQDALEIARRMTTSLKIQNEIGFGDMNIKPPDINFYADDDQFFDPGAYEIHIGVLGLIKLFKPNNEEEFLSALNYVRGHEEQHVRSTATKPYAIGIKMGTQAVLEYISSKEEKTKRRFRSDNDYIDFANRVLPSMGLYISMNMIQQIIAGISNSVEDGRIERIRSVRFPGFEKLRIVHRGIFWQDTAEKKPYDEIKDSPVEKMQVILNEILSLATCQLYTKGFIATYAGTPMVAEVNAMMPHIALGVMAARTRDMAAQVVEISKKLAPYIYEAVKLSESDIKARQALEKMLADMISSMVDQMPSNNLSEQDEDTEEEMGNSTFPMSDLVVTLPDDVYDKMVEKSKKGGGSGGLMIQREHPKEEEGEKENGEGAAGGQDEDDKSGKAQSDRKDGRNGSGNGQEQKSDEEGSEGQGSGKAGEKNEQAEGSGGSGESGENGDESGNDGQGGGSSEKSGDKESGEQGSGSADGSGDEKDDQNGSAASGDGGDESGSESEDGQKGASGKQSGKSGSKSDDAKQSGDESSEGDTSTNSMAEPSKTEKGMKGIKGKTEKPDGKKGDIDAVMQAMKEAAEQVNEKAKQDIDNVNATAAHEARTKAKDVPDTSKPITAEDVKGICPDFEEVKRQYKLTEKLPPVQMARGKSLLRKNQQYFKSLSTPNVSFLDSGTVDPGRIYGLAFGDTDVFRRKGSDKKFDGCAYILIDNSGSMSGNKRTEACKAAAVIEEGFRGLIPIKIVAFDYANNVIHEVVKSWDEQQTLNCCWNFCLKGRQGWGNADGYDIMVATKELLARPEQKKLLLVLSDGMPAEASPGFTKGAIKDARKKGIQVSGIYFEEGRVGSEARQFLSMYGDGTDSRDAVACSLDELDQNIEKIMKRFSRS